MEQPALPNEGDARRDEVPVQNPLAETAEESVAVGILVRASTRLSGLRPLFLSRKISSRASLRRLLQGPRPCEFVLLQKLLQTLARN